MCNCPSASWDLEDSSRRTRRGASRSQRRRGTQRQGPGGAGQGGREQQGGRGRGDFLSRWGGGRMSPCSRWCGGQGGSPAGGLRGRSRVSRAFPPRGPDLCTLWAPTDAVGAPAAGESGRDGGEARLGAHPPDHSRPVRVGEQVDVSAPGVDEELHRMQPEDLPHRILCRCVKVVRARGWWSNAAAGCSLRYARWERRAQKQSN